MWGLGLSELRVWGLEFRVYLPLVRREWRNGVQLYLLLLPFFHSLLTKGRYMVYGFRLRVFRSWAFQDLEFRVFKPRASGVVGGL